MPVTLEMLLQSSEVIFVLAIPSVENEAMLDREKLSLIQPKAVFLLMSRSHVVDFDALTDLLYQGRFRAAIDVFPPKSLCQKTIPSGRPQTSSYLRIEQVRYPMISGDSVLNSHGHIRGQCT